VWPGVYFYFFSRKTLCTQARCAQNVVSPIPPPRHSSLRRVGMLNAHLCHSSPPSCICRRMSSCTFLHPLHLFVGSARMHYSRHAFVIPRHPLQVFSGSTFVYCSGHDRRRHLRWLWIRCAVFSRGAEDSSGSRKDPRIVLDGLLGGDSNKELSQTHVHVYLGA
jgi:hypothetical protein